MGISRTPEINSYPAWGVDEGSPHVTRYAPLPGPAEMRRRSLFGLPLKSAFTGEAVSDLTLQDYINQAISEVEMTLDIYITPVKFTEKHDYDREMFTQSFAYYRLYHPNVLSVESVQISFTNDTGLPAAVTFPLEHVHIMPQEGVIQLVPAYGTSLSGFMMSAFSGVQYHAFNSAMLQKWPGAVRFTYTAGFPLDKVPAILGGIIEKMAAVRFLSALGPTLFPLSSTSIGIDGVSQSVSTPGPMFLKTRIEDLNTQIQSELTAAKGYYQRGILIDYI